MCGIWGVSYTGTKIKRSDIYRIVKKLMVLSETRGKDASGIAVLFENQLNVLRKAKSSHELLKDRDFLQYITKNILETDGKEIKIIGHSRLVTNGTQYNPNNNQPVVKKKDALVHNGIIVNEDTLWEQLSNANHEYEVDSEVILELFKNRYEKYNDLEKAIKQTYSSIRGMASTIILSGKEHAIIASSNNGSLYYVSNHDGDLVIFASEKLILVKLIESIFVLKKSILRSDIKQIKPRENYILKEDKQFEVKNSLLQDKASKKSFVNQQIDNYSKYEIDFEKIRKIRRCTKCVLPETMPFIEFDKDGVCNYCRGYHKAEYKGIDELNKWNVSNRENKNKTMVSFSGGRDSSYGLHYFVNEMGIKPVAYCYDWGMVTDIARRNQSRMCEKLGIEFILVSADIKKKRDNIKKNVCAWLKNPSLGMIPLFMAGDKHYFYYANKVCKDYGLNTVLLASNPFEKTYFKSGYCGVKPDILKTRYKKMDLEELAINDVLKMSGYYLGQFWRNKAYLNSSIIDTASAAVSYYLIPHNYFRLFDYIPWNEKEIDKVLINEYEWECAKDTESTWRIGDGTAPFYNYIYCMVAGFTENDTLRSNQVREGMISRDEALKMVYRDNQPRFDSMKWYFDTISVDMREALDVISKIPKIYDEK